MTPTLHRELAVKAIRSAPRWRFIVLAICALAALGAGRGPTVPRGSDDHSLAAPPRSDATLPESSDPFVPKQPRTEAEADRLEALALFSAARLQEQRQEFAEALRLYQRALRRDPSSVPVADAIVPLAAQLGRSAEAVRYAIKLAEIGPAEPTLARRLAVYLTELGDVPGALRLYERLLAERGNEKTAAEDTVLWMEMGRLYHLNGQDDKAAERFSRVLEVIDHPERFGLDKGVRRPLIGEKGVGFLLMGEAFLGAGRVGQAQDAFERADRENPNKAVLQYNLARLLAKQNQHEQAIEKVQSYFDAHSATEGMAPYRLLADSLKALKKESELLPRLEKMLAADPENVPLKYFLAEQHYEAGRLDKAEGLYRGLVEKEPTVAGLRNLVDIYRKTKRYDALLDVLGQTVRATGSLDAVASESPPSKQTPPGKSPPSSQEKPPAKAPVRKESASDQENALAADAELARGVIEAARKRLGEGKTLPYETALAAALLAIDAKQYDDAAALFEAAIKAKPDQTAKVLLSWGLELVVAEQHARAVEVFRRGIEAKLLPDEPTFQYYLAGALEMAGRTDEALAAARMAIASASTTRKNKETKSAEQFEQEAQRVRKELDSLKEQRKGLPNHSDKAKSLDTRIAARERELQVVTLQTTKARLTQRLLGSSKDGEKKEHEDLPRCLARVPWILYHAKRLAEADKGYRELLDKYASQQIGPQVRPVVREARLVLSNIAVARGDRKAAEEWAEQVLDEFPDDATALNDLGYLWSEQGKHLERSERMIRKALEEEPDNAAFRDSLGWVLYQKGRYGEAVAELEKAAVKENDPTVQEHLGDAYRKVGQPAKAHEAYRRAIEAFQKAGERDKAAGVQAKLAGP
jgi:tetratricopeptide (TPR) repeat protein